MHFAVDDLGNRISPFPKGKGWCPLCNSQLIAKCGEINIWHWQHFGERVCDDWFENETKWHLEWKEKFPPECREVIIEDDAEKHIADVKTPSGTIIEFQNSSISSTTIKIRENFYGDMVWIVNAIHFQERLRIRSIVSKRLREIEQAYKNDDFDCHAGNLPNYHETIRSLDQSIEQEEDAILKACNYLKTLDNFKLNLVDQIKDILKSWENGKSYTSLDVFRLNSIIESVKRVYDNWVSNIKDIEQKISAGNSELEWIDKFEKYVYDSKTYIIVPFEKLSGSTFFKTIAIPIGQKNSLFPIVKRFIRETDFLSLKGRTNEYEFGIDPSDRIERVLGGITKLKEELEKVIGNSPDFYNLLIEKISVFLDSEIKKVNNEIDSSAEKSFEYYSAKMNLEMENDCYIEEQEVEIRRINVESELEYKTSKSRIMSTFKGLYTFTWKNERKSWEYADSPVFFDLGTDYLFERIASNKLKKISKEEFLNVYMTDKNSISAD